MPDAPSSDDLATIGAARDAADAMLHALGVPVAKALDLSTASGFDAAVARLAAELQRLSALPETEAVRRAIAALDIDWRAASPAKRTSVLRAALEAAGRAITPIVGRIEAPLGRVASVVALTTRSDARRRQRLAIGADLNALDHRAIAYVRRSTALFAREEYGRRIGSFGERARAIVAHGLEQGLGRADIVEGLANAAGAALIRPSRSYWNVVAASFVGEGRSLAQISAYAEARVDRYVLVAVLDEVTTDTCRFLDGKVLRTSDALRAFERIEGSNDPLAIKRERPWIRERTGDDGRRRLVVPRSNGEAVLAVIERSGVGVRDDPGAFSRALDDHELAPSGVGFPPFHGCCRTTTVAKA